MGAGQCPYLGAGVRLVASYLEVCETAVRRAGRLLLDRRGHVTVRHKGRADLVTEADLAAQEVVRETILEAFPDHALLGEEDPPDRQDPGRQGAFCWIVDPLDGTTNYVHGVPFFSVSLALEHRGELLAGAIYDPISEECFASERGGGAFLNGRPIRVSGVLTLADALVAAGFPAAVTGDAPDLRLFNEIVLVCQAVRRTGSASLNLAYVAAGRLDALWSYATKVWDVAAGRLLIQEAGGVVTAFNGKPPGSRDGQVLAAATPKLHEELLLVVRRLGLR